MKKTLATMTSKQRYRNVNYESQQQKFNNRTDTFPTRENVVNILKDITNNRTAATMTLIEN
jgi:hypothetical protein